MTMSRMTVRDEMYQLGGARTTRTAARLEVGHFFSKNLTLGLIAVIIIQFVRLHPIQFKFN
jgi:hypothetical protein